MLISVDMTCDRQRQSAVQSCRILTFLGMPKFLYVNSEVNNNGIRHINSILYNRAKYHKFEI